MTVENDLECDYQKVHSENTDRGFQRMSAKTKHIVLDAGPLIEGNFPTFADALSVQYYCVSDVWNFEIRDAATKDRLSRAPYNICVQNATSTSLEAVRQIANNTGDIAVLSIPDLAVIALTLDLSLKYSKIYENGNSQKSPTDKESLRKENGSSNKGDTESKMKKSHSRVEDSLPGWGKSDDVWEEASWNEDDGFAASNGVKIMPCASNAKFESKIHLLAECSHGSECASCNAFDSVYEELSPDAIMNDDSNGWNTTVDQGHNNTININGNGDMKKRQSNNNLGINSNFMNSFEADSLSTEFLVACVTGDFAVQNVLLHMCLPLLTPNGRRIRELKSWLLRCHACYWTTREMEKRFCGRCGNGDTLIRTSYCVDGDSGKVHLFLKRHFNYNLRGTVAPIPLPVGGRCNSVTSGMCGSGNGGGGPLILREDQKEYRWAMKSHERNERKAATLAEDVEALNDRLTNVFGGNIIRSITSSIDGISASRDGKNSSQSSGKGNGGTQVPVGRRTELPVIGFGRKNPNAVPRRRG